MPYNIPFTDSANKGNIVVEDNSINTETSMKLPGRLLSDYGSSVNQNFLQLLENFANVNPPTNPVEGQLWYDTTDGIDQLKIYDGTNWVAAGGLKKATSEPASTNSVKGDLWVNTSTTQLYVYSGSGWILVGPEFSDGNKSGTLVEDIIDTGDVSRTCIIGYVDNIPVTIISRVEFSPKTPFAGYSSVTPIKVGVNFNTSLSTAKYNGTATTAENLVISGATIPSSTFMRNNIVNQVSEKLQIKNNQGIEVGVSKTLSMIVEGNNGIIENTVPGAPIDLRINNNGTFAVPIRVKSNTNVGINNLAPTESLDVVGNIKTDSNVIVNGDTESTNATTGSLKVAGGVGIVKNLNVGGNFVVDGNITTTNLLPDLSAVRSIGSSTLPYDTLYANRITGNLTGDVTGNVSGSAGSTAKLSSVSVFSLTGDISSTRVSFDGQTGGSTKTFTTTVQPEIISARTAAASIDRSTDTLLVNQGGTLYKATPDQLIGSIDTMPVGTIIMFGGLTAPTGWFFLDGTEKSLSIYGSLATVLGYNAADPTTWYHGTPSDPNTLFKIPDMRGRMPAGVGAPGGGSRIGNASIATMGGVNGNDEVTITNANLPDHQHDLRDSGGGQFYITTTATETASEVIPNDGDTSGTGTRLDTSGGVVDVANDAIDITNPFLALNFIIYHGVT
jgi:microcystin-dependent protein